MTRPPHVSLDAQGIPYEPRTFPPDIEKGAASVARALGVRERQMRQGKVSDHERHENDTKDTKGSPPACAFRAFRGLRGPQTQRLGCHAE